MVPEMSYKEWKNNFVTGLSAGNENDNIQIEKHDPPKVLGKIDYNDTEVVIRYLENAERKIVNSNIENAIVITNDGTIIQCFGTKEHNYFDTDLGLKKLEGAYVTHNHPVGSSNEYSFSNDDVNAFLNDKLAMLRGIDEEYIYVLTKNSTKVDNFIPLDEMDINGKDFRHNQMIEKSKILKIGYRRWKRG